MLALDSTHTFITLLRVGSDLQLDSLPSSATFPATYTHTMWRGGGPLYPTWILIAHSVQLPHSAKVCNRWLLSVISRKGFSWEACCNPTIVDLLLWRSFSSLGAYTAAKGARCLTRDVERKAGGCPISKFRSSHDRGNSSTIPAVRETRALWASWGASPRRWTCALLGMPRLFNPPPLSWRTISPMAMLRNARTAVSRKVCCTAGLLLDFLADIVAHDVHFFARQRWRKTSCLWALSGAEMCSVPVCRPASIPVEDVIEDAAGDVTPGGRSVPCWQLEQMNRNVGCCHNETGMFEDLALGGASDEHLE